MQRIRQSHMLLVHQTSESRVAWLTPAARDRGDRWPGFRNTPSEPGACTHTRTHTCTEPRGVWQLSWAYLPHFPLHGWSNTLKTSFEELSLTHTHTFPLSVLLPYPRCYLHLKEVWGKMQQGVCYGQMMEHGIKSTLVRFNIHSFFFFLETVLKCTF